MGVIEYTGTPPIYSISFKEDECQLCFDFTYASDYGFYFIPKYQGVICNISFL